MNLTAAIVVSALAYIIAELLKPIDKFNNKFIPYINLLVGIISAVIVIICDIGDATIIENILYCILYAMGATGIYEMIKAPTKIKEEK